MSCSSGFINIETGHTPVCTNNVTTISAAHNSTMSVINGETAIKGGSKKYVSNKIFKKDAFKEISRELVKDHPELKKGGYRVHIKNAKTGESYIAEI